jgi:ketosteroid isomerase-like protein
MGTVRAPADVVDALVEAWNGRDWAAVEKLYIAEVVWTTNHETFIGRDAVVARHRRDAEQHPEAYTVRTLMAVAGTTVFFESRSHLRATGERTRTPTLVSVVEVVDGRITTFRTFWHPLVG